MSLAFLGLGLVGWRVTKVARQFFWEIHAIAKQGRINESCPKPLSFTGAKRTIHRTSGKMNAAISTQDIVLRLLAATFAGVVVGWERESHGRPAGLRTTILTCVASAVAMILSEVLFYESATSGASANWRPDPARLGAGILTGIGFLGAGTILRHNSIIRGVTTAASLWFVTVLGLAFGAGEYGLGAIGVTIALITLFVLPALEKHIQSDWYATLTTTLQMDAINDAEFQQLLRSLGLKVLKTELDYDLPAAQKTLRCDLKLNRSEAFELSNRVVADLRLRPGVLRVKWSD